MPGITQERLKELFYYNPGDGHFRHRIARRGVQVGTIAGTINTGGYIQIKVDRRKYMAHRLAFLYMTGDFPNNQIDHCDLNKTNNRWANIREATATQNQANMRARGAIPLKGVCEYKGKYLARIQVGGKKKHIGSFSTAEDAHTAYMKAANDNFGEFARAF